MTLAELENLYIARLRGRFPYDDCRWVAERANIESGDLIPDLKTYFADVAGFCSSASRIEDRPIEKLRRAKEWLAMSFFERRPSLANLQGLIDADKTPSLHARIRDIEIARLALLEILEQINTE